MLHNKGIALTRIFYGLYALCFGWVLLCVVFANISYPRYGVFTSLLLMALYAAALWLAYRLLQRHAGFWRRRGRLVCAGVVLFTSCLQLVFAFAMRYETGGDLWELYTGAITWAENGTLAASESLLRYLHLYPNNLGSAYLFRLLFGGARLLGITDYYAVAVVFNVLGLQAALVLCWDVLRRIGGDTVAVLGLICFVVFPPFYMMGAVFYSDALTMAPPVLVLDLYLMARGQANPRRRVLLYALLGVVAALGAIVKFTVAIALVAVLIASFIARQKHGRGIVRKALLPCAAALVAFALVFAGYRVLVQGRLLEDERLEREAMPLTHWVAMGLIGDGGYDHVESVRTQNLPSRAARVEESLENIKARLTQPSVVDLAKLFTRKAIRCFGDGTYDLSIFLDDGPHRQAAVHMVVLEGERYYGIYSKLSQGAYLGFMLLALAAPLQAVFCRKSGRRALLHPEAWLCMFGLFAFLMLWETNSRYTMNFMPVLLVCACLGTAWLRMPKKRSTGKPGR